MGHAAVIAVIVAAATGAAALLVPRSLRPDAATRLMTALVLVSGGAAIWTLLLVIAANVVQLHGIAERINWCHDLVAHHRDSFTPMGVAAITVAGFTCASTMRVRRRQRRELAPTDGRELAIVASEHPMAYALPGAPGQVVVSTAMLRLLDQQERRVLLAHERSHLKRRHHRYIRLTEFAVAAQPYMAPLHTRLRFAIERWADEDAAEEIGDRAVVASAIARAALAAQLLPSPALAIADGGVVERVEFMLAGPSTRSRLLESAFGGVVLAGASGLIVSLAFVGPMILAVFGFCR